MREDAYISQTCITFRTRKHECTRRRQAQKYLSGHNLFLLKNACASNPCRNNATRQAGFTHRDYQCFCVFGSGFEGHDCDKGEESSKFFSSQ